MYAFNYQNPSSSAAAIAAAKGDARYLAGGQSLVQAMKLRLSQSATLVDLNQNYIRAAAEPDLGWYADNLADDYRATNPDGSFVDKAGFLARFKAGGPKKDYEAVDVNVRILGDVALIHSGF